MKPVRPTQILPAQLPLKTRGALAIASASIAVLCLLVSGCEGPSSLIGSMLRSPMAMLGLIEPALGSDDSSEPQANDAAEKLVEGWNKPAISLFVTGRLHGYIEPCGCTGLTNQKGGLLRRHTCLKKLREKGYDPALIDTGNMIRRFGQQASLKMKTAYRSIAGIMNYDAIGMGIDDMKAGGVDMLLAIEEVEREQTPFTSANLSLLSLIHI